ncbi:MAG: NAD(+) kinase [Methanobacteriaceae archaeon]|nr:NAD(+) kinase [Methanobacteriaceae archaeon]
MKIGIVARYDRESSISLTRDIIRYLHDNNVTVSIDDEIAKVIGSEYEYLGVKITDMESDIVICIGGDGTILKTQNALSSKKIPILSINMGTVGFLTEIEPEDTFKYLGKLLDNDYFVEERMQIDITHNGQLKSALNEVVIMTRQPAKMIHVEISVDDEIIDVIRADGLIISTPSGSTAYSMSAGGPIVDPRVNAILIVPICPFKLSSRPTIIPADSEIVVKFIREGKKAFAVIDGNDEESICYKDFMTLTKSSDPACFVRFKKDFYSRVHEKLTSG